MGGFSALTFGASKKYTDREILKKPIYDFITEYGTVLDNFDSVSGRTLSGITTALETENVAIGSHTGIAVTNTVAGTGGNMDMVTSLTLGANDVISFSVYIPGITKLSSSTVKLYLGTSASYANHFVFAPGYSYYHTGWNTVTLTRADFIVGAGTPSWDSEMVALRLRASPASGQTVTVIYGTMRKNMKATPKILFTFDDGAISVHEKAFRMMEQKNIKGTCYINSTTIGSAQKMTLENLKTLYKNGWDISNHTAAHSHLAALSLEDATTAISTCRDYLVTNGFVRSAQHLAYPYGEFNDTVIQAAIAATCQTARQVTVTHNTQKVGQCMPVYNKYALRCMLDLSTTTTLATSIPIIDNCIKYGATLIALGHSVADSSPGTYDILTSVLQEIVDYVATKDIETMTISEYYAQLGVSKHSF